MLISKQKIQGLLEEKETLKRKIESLEDEYLKDYMGTDDDLEDDFNDFIGNLNKEHIVDYVDGCMNGILMDLLKEVRNTEE